jgi:hypothetical protein
VNKQMQSAFSERELKQIEACRAYALNHADAGLPGHNMMILVSKLTTLVEGMTSITTESINKAARLTEKLNECNANSANVRGDAGFRSSEI